jgi:DNA polymerase-3 subunit beta
MKLTISQPALNGAIARGSAAAAKKSPLDILTHLRLTATDGTLALASSDHDRFTEAVVSADIAGDGGVCVDASTFKTLIAKYPKGGTITMEAADGQLLVSCGRSRVRMPTLPAESFPTWPDADPQAAFSMSAEDFFRAFKRVRFAASDSPAQYTLQGVVLDYHDGSLHFAATDTHRLAVSGVAAPEGAENCPQVIIPSEAVDAALAVFAEAAVIEVAVSDKVIGFAADGLRLSSKLIDGKFPDYAKVIPERGHPGMRVTRSDFVDCLDRANLMVGEGSFQAVIARPEGDTLRLTSRNQKGGEVVEEMPAKVTDGLGPFGFNSRYVAAFLSTLNVAELVLEHEGGMKPILVYSEDAPDFVGMLGPMRVAL